METGLTPADQAALLCLARDSIASHLSIDAPQPVLPDSPACRQELGAFVTLRKHRRLRGCLGWTTPRAPLSEAIAELAWLSASEDPRFSPVAAGELDDLSIEISVLSPVSGEISPNEIEIGRHGLIISKGTRRGLLLPQVATENGWNVPTFLAQTCVKAGLPTDAWKKGASIRSFSCSVFGDRREQE